MTNDRGVVFSSSLFRASFVIQHSCFGISIILLRLRARHPLQGLVLARGLVARIVHHGIKHSIIMTRIMMKKQKPADLGVERKQNGAGNRTVSPSDVFVGLCVGVLGVENQSIAALKKFNQTVGSSVAVVFASSGLRSLAFAA